MKTKYVFAFTLCLLLLLAGVGVASAKEAVAGVATDSGMIAIAAGIAMAGGGIRCWYWNIGYGSSSRGSYDGEARDVWSCADFRCACRSDFHLRAFDRVYALDEDIVVT